MPLPDSFSSLPEYLSLCSLKKKEEKTVRVVVEGNVLHATDTYKHTIKQNNSRHKTCTAKMLPYTTKRNSLTRDRYSTRELASELNSALSLWQACLCACAIDTAINEPSLNANRRPGEADPSCARVKERLLKLRLLVSLLYITNSHLSENGYHFSRRHILSGHAGNAWQRRDIHIYDATMEVNL